LYENVLFILTITDTAMMQIFEVICDEVYIVLISATGYYV